jgi:hypothetical protein
MKKSIFYGILVSFTFSNAQNIGFKNVSSTNLPEISQSNIKNSMDAKTGDIDNDGDIDIIVAIEFYKNIILTNDGKGNFLNGSSKLPDLKPKISPKPYPYYPYHDSEDIALEDFDKDGDLDLIFVSEDDEINEYYLNDGKGYFKNSTHLLPATGVSNGVLAGDFDQDGWIDVIIANNGQNIYLKNEKGDFTEGTKKHLPELVDITQDMQALDFDKDGDLDIIVANEKANTLLLNNGKGVFRDETKKYFTLEVLNDETREATFADIDNDGDFDIYFANVNMFQQLDPIQRLLINKGEKNKLVDETEMRLGFTKKYSIVDANFHDFDKDGDSDLLLLSDQGPKLFENNGKGQFTDITEKTIGVIDAFGVDTEIADFNNDGKSDIFISCFRGRDILLIQN